MFNQKSFVFVISLFIFAIFFPTPTKAYTPFGVNKEGIIITHDILNGKKLIWNIETGNIQDDSPARNRDQISAFCQVNPGGNIGNGSGGCSLNPFLKEAKADSLSSNAEGVNLVTQVLQTWKDQGGKYADTSFIEPAPGASAGDINVCNADSFIDIYSRYGDTSNGGSVAKDIRTCGCLNPKPADCNSECRNPIIFDPNGDITDELFGSANRTLVLASADAVYAEGFNNGHYIMANIVINGMCLDKSPDPLCQGRAYSTQDLTGIVTHEMGHALGLGHTQVNPQINATTRAAIGGAPNSPLMYAYVQPGQVLTIHEDDLVGLGHLYPKGTFPNGYCKVTGVIQNTMAQGLRCVEVVARKAANDPLEAIGAISGMEVDNSGSPGIIINSCTETTQLECGRFEIQGLKLNTNYEIDLNPIPAAPTSGSTIGPCGTNPPKFNGGNALKAVTTVNCGPIPQTHIINPPNIIVQ